MPSFLARMVRKILSPKEKEKEKEKKKDSALEIRIPEGTRVNNVGPAYEGPPVPALPKKRPRVLTPSPSNEDLCKTAAAATADCAFFQKLPCEIRRQILVEAFGGRTVHMDLWYDHPEAPITVHTYKGRTFTEPAYSHCGRNRTLGPGDHEPFLRVDETQPKRWIWRSSVCHRDSPRGMYKTIKVSSNSNVLNAAEDRCRYGGASLNICETWPGDKETKCFIGAMGWLLSCRQAYVEGIDVLYGTNTIHTASKEMLLNLDRLLLPQRLSAIRSIELAWYFRPFPYPNPGMAAQLRPYEDFQTYYKFLETIPRLFPNIKSLYLAIQGDLTPMSMPPGHGVSLMEEGLQHSITDKYIMTPIDDMVRKLGPRVRDCSIAVESGLYRTQRERAVKDAAVTVDQVHLGALEERYWRRLEAEGGRGAATAGEQREGYWVYLGVRGMVRMMVCTFAQGGDPFGENKPERNVFYTPSQLLY